MTKKVTPTPALPNPVLAETIGIREFSKLCEAANLDEWTALLRLTGGDHAAMTLLRFALRWGEATAVQAAGGWFYREANEFANEAALTRGLLTRARKCLGARLGLQERRDHPRLPGGDYLLKIVVHYRLEPVVFRAAFDLYCLSDATRTVCKTLAELQALIKQYTLLKVAKATHDGTVKVKENTTGKNKKDTAGLQQNDIPTASQDDTAGVHQNDCYKDSNKESFKSSSKASNNLSIKVGAEREISHPEKFELPDFLGTLFDQLGTPNGRTADILEECTRLGDKVAAAVVGRCSAAGSWQYVLNALRNEAAKPEVQVVIAEREYDEARRRQYDADKAAGLLDDAPVFLFVDDSPTPLTAVIQQPDYVGEKAAVWATAYAQLKLQFDQAKFDNWLRDARLIDYRDGMFVVEVGNDMRREMLQNRLYRSVARVVSDALGSTAKIQFVTAQRVGVAS